MIRLVEIDLEYFLADMPREFKVNMPEVIGSGGA